MDTKHGRDGDTVKGPVRAGASGFEPLEVNSPMAKWKKPQPIDFVDRATRNYSFPNWQSGNEDSIYYNLNIQKRLESRRRHPLAAFRPAAAAASIQV